MTRALIGCAAAFAALLHPAGASAAAPKRKPAVRAAPHITVDVVSEGKGASPGQADMVLIAYVGRLKDGTIFDMNNNAALPVNGVVDGFSQALRRMKVGGSYHVAIPPTLGYGNKPSGPIPAGSTLIFDIMLFDFKTGAEVEAMTKQMEAEQAASPKPIVPPKP